MRLRRGRLGPFIAGVTLLASLTGTAGPAGAAAFPKLDFTGNAYGSEVTLAGGVINSGPSAPVVLGCIFAGGVQRTNTIASVSALPALATGTVSTSASTTQASGMVTSKTTATIQRVNLLLGMVKADAITADSATTYTSSGFQTSAAGSGFVNLVVAGHAESGTPPANTTVPLPGIGYVILNQQTVSSSGQALTVNMIHIVITVSSPLGASGANIVVSHASSDLEGPIQAIVDGHAYGTSAAVSPVIKSGPSAEVWVPCQGTGGTVHTNSTVGVAIPGVLSSGTVSNTSEGTVSNQDGSAQTTSSVESLNLGGGMVTADAIHASARASDTNGGKPTFSSTGSSFLNLVVNGQAESSPVPPNTMIPIPNVGTLWLDRIIQTHTSIEVRMIELIVTAPNNPLGLTVGLDVRVAVAEASVHPTS
jgi:hypothetical protein